MCRCSANFCDLLQKPYSIRWKPYWTMNKSYHGSIKTRHASTCTQLKTSWFHISRLRHTQTRLNGRVSRSQWRNSKILHMSRTRNCILRGIGPRSKSYGTTRPNRDHKMLITFRHRRYVIPRVKALKSSSIKIIDLHFLADHVQSRPKSRKLRMAYLARVPSSWVSNMAF